MVLTREAGLPSPNKELAVAEAVGAAVHVSVLRLSRTRLLTAASAMTAMGCNRETLHSERNFQVGNRQGVGVVRALRSGRIERHVRNVLLPAAFNGWVRHVRNVLNSAAIDGSLRLGNHDRPGEHGLRVLRVGRVSSPLWR